MVVAAVMFARTGTVLINRPTIDSAPATSAGRPETVVPKATSCWPVSEDSSCAQAPCSTVLTVVWQRARQFADGLVISAGSWNVCNASLPRLQTVPGADQRRCVEAGEHLAPRPRGRRRGRGRPAS